MTTLAGIGVLIRLALRRDLLPLLAWTALFCALLAATTASFRDTYPDAAALAGYAAAMSASPMQHFFNGPGAALDTHGGMIVFEMGGYLVVVVALLSILTVVRHSRAEEANGDAELVRAGCVGRHALGGAAAVVAIASAAWWGVVCAVTLGLLGLGWVGAAAYGLSLTAAGALFATVTAVTCQLGEHPRTATSLAGAVLAVSFVVRGLGDLRGDGLVWLSPLGWAQGTRPFGDERLWPLLLSAVVVIGGHLLAAALNSRRDLGAGWWPTRPGPATASTSLRRLGGLIGAQQRPAAYGWWVVLGGLGLAFGLVAQEFSAAGDQLDLSSFVPDASDPVTALVDFSALLLAVLAAGTGVVLVGVAAGEETSGRLDATLAGAVRRSRWLGWQLGGALAGSGLALAVGAAGLAGGLALTDVEAATTDTLSAVLAYLPATWVIVALASVLLGVRPRLLALAWLPVAHAVVAGLFGPALRLPQWVIDVSPFSHVPRVPAESVLSLGLTLVTVLTVALLAVGVRAFLARDLRV